MPYCTPNDVKIAFPRTMTSGLTPTELDPLCQFWSDWIDGFIAVRYPVPVSPTPGLLKFIAAELVALDILDRSPKAPDFIPRRKLELNEQLQAIAKGDVSLPGILERTDVGIVRSTTRNYVPTFGAIPSLGERHDPNRADDEDFGRRP